MRQWIGLIMVQIMACCLFGTKPLSEPMLGYYQLDHKEQTSVKFWSKYKTFHSRKHIWKYWLWNGEHFVPGRCVNYIYQVVKLRPTSIVCWCHQCESVMLCYVYKIALSSANLINRMQSFHYQVLYSTIHITLLLMSVIEFYIFNLTVYSTACTG